MNWNDERHSKINKTKRKQISPLEDINLSNLYNGLELLLQASNYQNKFSDLPMNKLEFAVEISEIVHTGLTKNDLRILTYYGYLIHLIETTSDKDKFRKFKDSENLEFKNSSCFLLTAKGIELAQLVSDHISLIPSISQNRTVDYNGDEIQPVKLTPVWYSERRELRFDGIVLKRFSRTASNQEAILSAFQEDGWPERIDNPLPPKEGLLCKARLRNAIQKLNELLQVKVICFRGDGTGEGVIWQRVTE